MTPSEQKARVSVIIPAYNAEAFLGQAIQSVLAQNWGDVECIIVDDGSTDGTGAIAKSFGDRVRYLSQENAERSAARNKGIAASTGEYLAFLDADDSIAPEKLADQVRFLLEHPEYGAVYSRVWFFREGSRASRIDLGRPTPEGDLLRPLLLGNFIPVHAPLIRKVAVEAVGGFDPRLSHNEDWEFLLRLALAGYRFGFIDAYHAYCRLHDANTTLDEITMHRAKWEIAAKFVEGHREELRRKEISTGPVLAYHEADFGKCLIASGAVEEGRRHIFSACRERFPSRIKYLLFALSSFFWGMKRLSRVGGGAYRKTEKRI